MLTKKNYFFSHARFSKTVEKLLKCDLKNPSLYLLKKYAEKTENQFFQKIKKKYSSCSFWEFPESDLTDLKSATKIIYDLALVALHNGNYDLALDICKVKYDLKKSISQKLQLDLLETKFFTEWSYAIGHMALLWYFLILNNNLEVPPIKRIIVENAACNQKLLSLFRPYVHDIITDSKKYGSISHIFGCCVASKMNPTSFPILKMDSDDDDNLLKNLRSIGYDKSRWICALHIRETEYLNLRNAVPESYQSAIQQVYKHGGICIRIGQHRSSSIYHKNIIDLARLENCLREALDIYVIANCKMFIGTNSGPSFLATSFQKPVFFTNWWPVIRPTHFAENLVTPKRIIFTKTGKPLAFDSPLYAKIGLSEDPDIQKKYGFKVVDNTDQEISDGVVQLIDEVIYGRKIMYYQNPLKKIKDTCKYKIGEHDARIPMGSINSYS